MTVTPSLFAVLDGGSVPRSIRADLDSQPSMALHYVQEINGAAISPTNPLPCSDSNSAAFQGVAQITPGTPVTAARALGYLCTGVGNVTLTLADGSTITIPLVASTALQILPFAVTNVALGSGTAGTFWNLK